MTIGSRMIGGRGGAPDELWRPLSLVMPGGQWVQARSAALVVASPGGRCGLAWGSPRRDGVAGAGRRSGYMGGARLPDRYPAGQVEYCGEAGTRLNSSL